MSEIKRHSDCEKGGCFRMCIEFCNKAEQEKAAQPTQEAKDYPHTWDAAGECCVVCGGKDWLGGGCIAPSTERVTPQPDHAELVARLRDKFLGTSDWPLAEKAATAITALSAQVAELEGEKQLFRERYLAAGETIAQRDERIRELERYAIEVANNGEASLADAVALIEEAHRVIEHQAPMLVIWEKLGEFLSTQMTGSRG